MDVLSEIYHRRLQQFIFVPHIGFEASGKIFVAQIKWREIAANSIHSSRRNDDIGATRLETSVFKELSFQEKCSLKETELEESSGHQN